MSDEEARGLKLYNDWVLVLLAGYIVYFKSDFFMCGLFQKRAQFRSKSWVLLYEKVRLLNKEIFRKYEGILLVKEDIRFCHQ